MPPFVPRKRARSVTPPPSTKPTSVSTQEKHTPNNTRSSHKKKPNLFEAVDSKSTTTPTLAENEALLKSGDSGSADSSDDSSDGSGAASELDSDEFEDALPASPSKRRKVDNNHTSANKAAKPSKSDSSDEDEEDEMEWEDATKHTTEPVVSGDLHLTLDELPEQITSFTAAEGQRKGPSKVDRQMRTGAHCMHVQSLMYHNFLRNRWLNDEELHKTLLTKIPSWMMREVHKYKAAVGIQLDNGDEQSKARQSNDSQNTAKKPSKKHKNQRDWGNSASHSDHDLPFLTAGDPTVPFLRILLSFWRKKFNPTAPGLRKQGYREPARIAQELKSFRNDEHDPEEHGERIRNIKEFRALAKSCSGSRDVGAQLFTALLRAIGLEARMTTNLQPIGFGFSKNEEAPPPRKKDKSKPASSTAQQVVGQTPDRKPVKYKDVRKEAFEGSQKPQKPAAIGTKGQPISLSDDESELSSVPDSDDESVMEVSPPDSANVSSKRYDRDLTFPVYWTEVLSPVSQTWIPLDPIVLSIIITKPEDFMKFEPRGPRAEKARQVFAYVVSFSRDSSAKDVTVRYLKNRMWPGKTKGFRIPVEKVPVYKRRSKKIDHYEEYDWFKRVMSCYTKTSQKRTAADDVEDSRELVAVKPNRQSGGAGEETLQGYKKSAEFVLERHLRREEALLPKAKSVKTFKTGKGETEKEEPVYRRADVVNCKSTESWHKEGLEVKEGEQPLKHVPVRAVTTIRKREIEEAERESGEKLKQGLYARYQTDWIIPPPIENGIIPKNAFNNIDIYVPSMVPQGAVHIPLKGTAKVCRRLEINYAEACTGFEFGNRMAVPVITGVVVAEENEHAVIDAWETEEAEKRKKEQAKREKLALSMWKKMLSGLRVLERVKREYGEGAELQFDSIKANTVGKKGKKSKDSSATPRASKPSSTGNEPGIRTTPDTGDIDMDAGEGGFLREGDSITDLGGGGFLPDSGAKYDTNLTKRDIEEGSSSSPLSEPEEAETNTGSDEFDNYAASEHSKQRSTSKKQGRKELSRTPAIQKNNTALGTKSVPSSSGARKRRAPSRKTEEQQATPSTGRRNASRKSKESVRSQYFEDTSDFEN